MIAKEHLIARKRNAMCRKHKLCLSGEVNYAKTRLPWRKREGWDCVWMYWVGRHVFIFSKETRTISHACKGSFRHGHKQAPISVNTLGTICHVNVNKFLYIGVSISGGTNLMARNLWFGILSYFQFWTTHGYLVNLIIGQSRLLDSYKTHENCFVEFMNSFTL